MQEPTLFDIAISSGMISLLSWPLYVFFAMTQGMTLATNSTKLEQLWWTLDTVWLQLIGGFSWHLPCTYDPTPEILIILTKKILINWQENMAVVLALTQRPRRHLTMRQCVAIKSETNTCLAHGSAMSV